MKWHAPVILLALQRVAAAPPKYTISIQSNSSYSISILDIDDFAVVSNTAVLSGQDNSTVVPIQEDDNHTSVSAEMITPSIARIQVNSTLGFTGARFEDGDEAKHYGVWGYPWDLELQNKDISFDLKGLQGNAGINFLSARSPFYLSSQGYAVYADTMAMGSYAFTGDKSVEFVFNSTTLTYYIILPRKEFDFKSLLEQYAELSDTTALWSPGSYGPMVWHNDFQRTSGYPEGVSNSQEFVQDVADKLFDNGIKASTIMVDRPFGTGTEGWGNFDFNATNWPDIEGLIANLADQGIDLEIWVANRAVPGSQLHDRATKDGWLFSEMVTEEDASIALDLSIPEAYDYMRDRMSAFTDLGIKGYKIDRGDEDEMPAWEQNIQSYLYHKLLYENQASRWGTPRPGKPAGFYNFARSVVDRSRKYTGVWAADPASTFDGLRYSIKSGIRAGLLGFPMWGSDCGGYTRKVGDGRPSAELWARWMWFSAFSPVYEMMLYEGSIPWYDYSDDLVSVLRETAALHVQLIPFIQSYMARATKDRLPAIRAAFLEAPTDPKAWDVESAYFFGAEFYVAPIVSDAGDVTVYFPEGSRYLDYFDKTDVFEGGTRTTVARDVDSVPAYVREGAIVPRGDLYRFNALWNEDWEAKLTVEVFPGPAVRRSSFDYYNEEAGKLVKIHADFDDKKDRLCVGYGSLGTEGSIRVYVKGGVKEAKLKKRGGRACFEQIDTLFE